MSDDSLKPLELAVKIREELLRIRQEKSCEGESLLRLDIGSEGRGCKAPAAPQL